MAETWTVLRILKWTEEYFRERGIEEARLDAQVLLADLLGIDRVGLYLNFDRPLTAGELAEFRSLVARRARREPTQYITGKAEFWSLSLRVAPGVLIPRPDTEILVEEALRRMPAAADSRLDVVPYDNESRLAVQSPAVLDVGTGSGAIAIAIAHERPETAVTAIDLSPEALALAAENAERNGLAGRIDFQQADLSALPEGPFDLIVANPPYIPAGEIAVLMPEIRDFEPHLALDGGADGLAAYRHLCRQSPERLRRGGWLLVEVGAGQAEAVRELFLQSGLTEVFAREDYAGIPRAVGGRKI